MFALCNSATRFEDPILDTLKGFDLVEIANSKTDVKAGHCNKNFGPR